MKKITLLFAALAAVVLVYAGNVSFVEMAADNMTAQGICITPGQGSNTQSAPVINTNGTPTLRLYAGNTITIDAGDVFIESIVLNLNGATNRKRLTTMEASAGSVLVDSMTWTATWIAPQDSVSVVTMEVGSTATLGTESTKAGQIHILSIDVAFSAPEGSCSGPQMDTIMLNINDAYYIYYEEYSDEGAYNHFTVLADTISGVGLAYDLYMTEIGEFSGTYNTDNGNLDVEYCYYYYGTGENDYDDPNDAWLTISPTPIPDQYHFEGGMLVGNTLYLVDYTGALVEEGSGDDPYAYEPQTPTTINFAPEDITVNDWTQYNYPNVDIYLENEVGALFLAFNVAASDSETAVPEGTYSIDFTENMGTVLASAGVGELGVDGSYYMTDFMLDTTDGEYYPTSAYFLESGTVTVSKSSQGVKIVVAAMSHFGSTINAVYEGPIEGGQGENPYEMEPQEVSEREFVAEEIFDIYVAPVGEDTLSTASEAYLYLVNNEPSGLVIGFMLSATDDDIIIPEGTYEITDTYDDNTMLAFSLEGYAEGQGSYLMTDAELDDDGEYTPTHIFFLESGSVKVEKSVKGIKIDGTAKSHFGSTIHFSYEGPVQAADALEDIKALDINTPMYNVLGVEVGKDYKGIVIQNGKKFMVK